MARHDGGLRQRQAPFKFSWRYFQDEPGKYRQMHGDFAKKQEEGGILIEDRYSNKVLIIRSMLQHLEVTNVEHEKKVEHESDSRHSVDASVGAEERAAQG